MSNRAIFVICPRLISGVFNVQKTSFLWVQPLIWFTLLLLYLLSGSAVGAVMPNSAWIQSLSQGVSSPTALAIDANERLYVAESSENRVLVLNPYGEVEKTIWGLNQPISVAAGSDASIYVGSVGEGRVSVFNADLQLLRKLGAGDGEFTKPSDIAVDSVNRVYVVDSKENAVKIYRADGSFVSSFGELGNTPGKFTTPIAIALNEAAGELIVSDLAMQSPWTPSARIQIFDMDGAYLRSFYTIINGEGYLRPFAVAVDSSERIYVADAYQNVVAIYDSTGNNLGLISDSQHPFRTPLGMVHSAGKSRLFVTSLNSARVDVLGLDNFDPLLDVRSEDGALLGGSADFGDVVINKTSSTKQITVTNNGNGNLVIGDVSFAASNLGEFAIPNGGNSCDGKTLTPLSSCTVDVTFSPVVEGSKTTQLHIASNALDAPVTTTTLIGNGVQPARYTVTVQKQGDGTGSVQGGGIDCGEDCSEEHEDETSVTLTATTEVGSIFHGWSGAGCLGIGSCEFDLSSDVSITALFSIDEYSIYSITATAGAHGSISPSGVQESIIWSDATYAITPDHNYQIKTLVIDGSAVDVASTYTFSGIVADHTIDVEFEPVPNVPFAFESGVVTESDEWVPVLFNRSFVDPVVVAMAVNNNPLVIPQVQIRSVTPTGFELRLTKSETSYAAQESMSDVQLQARVGGLVQLSNLIRGKRTDVQERRHVEQQAAVASSGSGAVSRAVRVSYLVVEKGSHQLPDGSRVEADSLSLSQGAPFARTLFTGTYSVPPVVMASVTTLTVDGAVSVALDSVAVDGFDVRLAEGVPGQIENVAYVAWEPSVGIIDGIHFEVNQRSILGDGSNKPLSYLNSHLHHPILMGGIQSSGRVIDAGVIWQFETTEGAEIRLNSGVEDELGYMVFSLSAVAPDVDSDGDGLQDLDEVSQIGSNPILADTDGDGLNDGDEKAAWDGLWNVDSDGDGVINLLDYDSDNDGFSDGVERDANSDPFDPGFHP